MMNTSSWASGAFISRHFGSFGRSRPSATLADRSHPNAAETPSRWPLPGAQLAKSGIKQSARTALIWNESLLRNFRSWKSADLCRRVINAFRQVRASWWSLARHSRVDMRLLFSTCDMVFYLRALIARTTFWNRRRTNTTRRAVILTSLFQRLARQASGG
jgi:hypothetical protein